MICLVYFNFVLKNNKNTTFSILLAKLSNILGGLSTKNIDEFKNLYYNFLTDSNTLLIDTDYIGYHGTKGNLKNILGDDIYNLEVLNNWLV